MNIIPIERPDPFDYQAFPKDAFPCVPWGPEIPTRFTRRAGVTSLSVVCASIALALPFQLIACWNIYATLVACILGFLFAAYFSVYAGRHYLSRLAADPRVLRETEPVLVNGKPLYLRSLQSPPFSKTEKLLLVVILAIAVFFCAVALRIETDDSTFGAIENARVLFAAFLFLSPIGFFLLHVLSDRNTCPFYVVLRHAKQVFCFWFEKDYPPEVPNAFRSPAGPLGIRILAFSLPVLFFALSLPWLCYYAPFLPKGFADWLQNEVAVSRSDGSSIQFTDDARLSTDGPKEQTDSRQRNAISKQPLGWIKALPGSIFKRPLQALVAILISFLAAVVLTVFGVVSVLVSFVGSDALIPRAMACLEVASKHSFWDSLSHCLLASSDRYEQQSIYLGRIVP